MKVITEVDTSDCCHQARSPFPDIGDCGRWALSCEPTLSCAAFGGVGTSIRGIGPGAFRPHLPNPNAIPNPASPTETGTPMAGL
jgi:hypothetical protein